MAVTIVVTGIVAAGYWIHDGKADLDRVAATLAAAAVLLYLLNSIIVPCAYPRVRGGSDCIILDVQT